jgi:NAD(P)-dependent dehydrogenase (short-subunit alcohol dehydrogenase family)
MKDTLFDVSDKIVIITGGLGQIGAEFVKEFHRRGARVAVFSRSADKVKAEEVLGKEIVGSPSIGLYQVNICDKKSINNALDALASSWGVPDVLINNAGIDTQPSAPPEVSGPFENFPEEVFREVVDTNLIGTFLMIQAAGSRMAEAGKGGSIINIG